MITSVFCLFFPVLSLCLYSSEFYFDFFICYRDSNQLISCPDRILKMSSFQMQEPQVRLAAEPPLQPCHSNFKSCVPNHPCGCFLFGFVCLFLRQIFLLIPSWPQSSHPPDSQALSTTTSYCDFLNWPVLLVTSKYYLELCFQLKHD